MRLFLYGTLQAASGTEMARWLHDRVSETTPASLPGTIHAVPSPQGWYPALLRGHGRVQGTLADCALARRDLIRLDRYEGHEYRRKAMRARGAGATVVAQAWIWRGPLPADAVAVAGGDFLSWLAQTGNRAFAG